jgi:hypothetical protein
MNEPTTDIGRGGGVSFTAAICVETGKKKGNSILSDN